MSLPGVLGGLEVGVVRRDYGLQVGFRGGENLVEGDAGELFDGEGDSGLAV